MGTAETLVMAVFGLLVLGALVLSIRQGAQKRAQVARYSASHGWSVSALADARLNGLLEESSPEEVWRAQDVMLVEQPPRSFYLFGYQSTRKNNPSSRGTIGNACLAEHAGLPLESPVTIFTRTPGLDSLISGAVKAGGEEFRRKFSVTCRDAGSALAVVNAGLEAVLLEHDSGPGWKLDVTIADRALLVSSTWARSEAEWDYLVALTMKLRSAVR